MRSRKTFPFFVLLAVVVALAVGTVLPAMTGSASPLPRLTPELWAYLPYAVQPLPTDTPTVAPAEAIVNGNFEAGPAGWNQFSSNGWTLILPQEDLPVPARSGTWAVWLGGDDNETSTISQPVAVPTTFHTLQFWYWIASQDSCGHDFGRVLVNDVAVDSFDLCNANNTGGWSLRTVSLAAYTGQTVSLGIGATTNGSLNSNLFVDDVSLGLTAAADYRVVPFDSAAAEAPRALSQAGGTRR